MDFIEFSGKDTEEALARASEHFEVPLDRLQIEVVQSGSSGLFGIGSRKAKVLARPAGPSAQEEVAEVLAVVSGEQPAPPPPAEPAPEPQPTPAPQPVAEDKFEAAPVTPTPAEDADPGSDFGAPRISEPPSPELVASARQCLARLLDAMEPDCSVEARLNERSIELEIVGGETGIIIGRRGQTLEALQYLVTRIVSHEAGRAIRVSVDTGGYRQRRFDSLADLALRMGAKARETGRPVAVGPLNSQERRVVHMALRGERGLSTVSRGRGDLKKVVISPR